MRKLAILLTICVLAGCASLSYTAPDGTKVTYTRFMTGSDTIKGTIRDAKIESQGQKAIDPATLQAVFDILGKVK